MDKVVTDFFIHFEIIGSKIVNAHEPLFRSTIFQRMNLLCVGAKTGPYFYNWGSQSAVCVCEFCFVFVKDKFHIKNK